MNSQTLAGKLIDGCRVLVDDGQGDLIWGHVTVRHPSDPSRLLMKPAGIGLEELTEADVIEVDLAGGLVAGTKPRHVEVFIHTEIMRARPEVQAVVHTHPPHAVAFSALDRPLLPVSHEGSLFCRGLPVFSHTSDLIVTEELGRMVAGTLSDHNAVLLRNHGIVTAGRSIEEAVMTAIMLEKACRIQMMAEAAGGVRVHTPVEEAMAKRARIYSDESLRLAFDYCVRRHSACCHHLAGHSKNASRF
jgi:L-ribulose-5-phosphate 4-epimerase